MQVTLAQLLHCACAKLPEVMKVECSWCWYLHNFESVICILWLSNLRIISTSCLLEHSKHVIVLLIDVYYER